MEDIYCNSFLKGECTSRNCKKSHNRNDMPDCTFFIKGKCTNNNCKYNHRVAPKTDSAAPKVAPAASKVAPASNVLTKKSPGKLTIMPPIDSMVTFENKGVTYPARVLSSNYNTDTVTLQEITGGIIYHDIPVNMVKPEIADPFDPETAMPFIDQVHDTCGNDVCPASITDDEGKYYELNRQLGFYANKIDILAPQYLGQSYEERLANYRNFCSRMITECDDTPTSGFPTSTAISLFQTPREFRNARNELTDAITCSKQECRGCLSLVQIAMQKFQGLTADAVKSIYDRLTNFKVCGDCCHVTYCSYSLDDFLLELECLNSHVLHNLE